ncbi:hypothetical protein EYF80_020619 [Liparis tanakae]|uniref:Uncharacterized protein n=1 Tax=Liparis tanakae TaxID=230148 RepID=A0A4Z2HW82_9TELE|nr:hypothetical protein EYF80_020619 [Liparis tanakae]
MDIHGNQWSSCSDISLRTEDKKARWIKTAIQRPRNKACETIVPFAADIIHILPQATGNVSEVDRPIVIDGLVSTHNLYLTSTCSGRRTPIKKKEGWGHRHPHRRVSAEDVRETKSGKEVQRQRERVPGRDLSQPTSQQNVKTSRAQLITITKQPGRNEFGGESSNVTLRQKNGNPL